MPSLQIQLLSDFHLLADGKPVVGLHQPRLQSCLAYLLRHCHAPRSRQQLAFLFWPDSTEKQAQTNLRKLLYHLRNSLPHADQFLQIETQTVWWLPNTPISIDVTEFEEKLAQAHAAKQQGDGAGQASLLAEAIALYRGDFLRGCYDDWVLAEREALHQQSLAALDQLIAWLEETGDYPAAIRYGHRQLSLDPLHEVAYQKLMRLYALRGDRSGALRIYQNCVDQLARELGVEPSTATQELYARLLQQEIPAPPVHMLQRTGSTQLVGREAEWRQLQRAWQLATNVRPHFALVAGEAGIGKTRLVEELRTWATQQGITTAHARAYAAAGSLAYAPVIDWLGGEPFQAALAQLDTVWRSELARLLPDLLVQDPTLPPPEPLTERWQRQRLFEALARLISLVKAPLLLALDDLQWCDAETLEWLHYLLRTLGEERERTSLHTRLMVVGTARVEELNADHPLRPLLLGLHGNGQVTEIELGPLDAANTVALAKQAADHTLDDNTIHRIVEASEGSPLFVVEMVRSSDWGVAAGNHAVPRPFEARSGVGVLLPPKVQAVIQSRLEQLSPLARELAGLAAVIGRSFTFNVLAHATDTNEDVLVQALEELWQRRIVREQGGDAYDFSHDRIRETTYATISPPRRRHLHQRVAQALAHIHIGDLEAVSGQLAVHYAQAGLLEQAVVYYEQAATVALRLYAYREGIYHLQHGLNVLTVLPTTRDMQIRELKLLHDLAETFFATQGYASPEAGATLKRALGLCRSIGDDAKLHGTQQRIFAYYLNTGELELAVQSAKDSLVPAQTLNEPTMLYESQAKLSFALFHLAHFSQSLHHYQQSHDIPPSWQLSNSQFKVLEQDSRFTRYNPLHIALGLWVSGYPSQAEQFAQMKLTWLEREQNPLQLVCLLEWTLVVEYFLHNISRMCIQAEKIEEIANQHEIPMYQALGALYGGYARARYGETELGIMHIHQSLALLKSIKLVLFTPYALSLLVEIYEQTRQHDEALTVLEEAFAIMERTGETWLQAELFRRRGQLLLATNAPLREIEDCYQQALATARQQEARSFELRAATSLASLWQGQRKYVEAYALLSPVYEWFIEGFDTPDLQAAKSLLDELSSQLPS